MPSERERRAAEREENQNRLIGEEQLGSESEHDSESESEGDPPTQTNDDVLPEGYHQVMRDINAALKSKGDYARQVPKLIKHLKVDQFLVVKDVALGNKNSSECDAKVVAQLYKLPLMLELMFEFETRVKENRFNNTSKTQKKWRYKDLSLSKWLSAMGLSPETFLTEFVKQLVAQEITDRTCYGRILYLSCDRDGRSVLDALDSAEQEDWALVRKTFTEHYGVEDFVYFNIRLLTDVPQDQNVNNVVNNLTNFMTAVHELAINVGEPHMFVNALMLRRIPDEVRKNVLTVMQARRQTINMIQIQKLRKLITTKAKEIIKGNNNGSNNNNNDENHDNKNNDSNNNNNNDSNSENSNKKINNYGIQRLDTKVGDCFNCGAPNFNSKHKCSKDQKGVIQLHPDYVKSAGLASNSTK